MTHTPDEPAGAELVRFGRFRIEQTLGADGMGMVEKAFDTVLRVVVALKTIRRELALSDPDGFAELRERFRREAIAGAQLRGSPYLVTVYELNIAEETPYLVQEFVPGGDLRHLLRQQGALPVERAREIAGDAARGLAYMHARDLVHRDIKPGNLFLTLDGHTKVGDFGIVQDGLSQRTQTAAHGHPYTLGYASPEQMTSTGYLPPATDQFSLGLVLFEMLTGRRYRDLSPQTAARLLDALPPDMATVFRQMTAEDPDDRYPDMDAVVDALVPGEALRIAPPPATTAPFRQSTVPPGRGAEPTQPARVVAAPRTASASPPGSTDVGVSGTQWDAPPSLPVPSPPVVAAVPPAATPHAFSAPAASAVPPPPSRRALLIGAGVLLLGGAAGGTTLARSRGLLGAVTVATETPMPPVSASAVPSGVPLIAPLAAASPSAASSPAPVASPTLPLPLASAAVPLPPTDASTPRPPAASPTLATATAPYSAPASAPPRPPMGTPMPRITAPAANGEIMSKLNSFSSNNAGVSVRDCVVSATFRNPADGDKAPWTYGFVVRQTDKQRTNIYVSANGTWLKSAAMLDASRNTVFDKSKERAGSIANMRRGETDTNDLQLILNNTVGELTVNGATVAAFNLGENLNAGDVGLGVGFSRGDQPGLTTKYMNFAVAVAPPLSASTQRAATSLYGPATGAIGYSTGMSGAQEVSTSVILRDGTVSMRVFNPYAAMRGAWDYGIVVRRSDTKITRVMIRSDKTWALALGTKAASDPGFGGNSYMTLRTGMIPSLRTNMGESNDVMLQLMGYSGALLVNGVRVSDLDLTANNDEGQVRFGIQYAPNAGITGEMVRYEEFIITA